MADKARDDFTGRLFDAINGMLLDFCAQRPPTQNAPRAVSGPAIGILTSGFGSGEGWERRLDRHRTVIRPCLPNTSAASPPLLRALVRNLLSVACAGRGAPSLMSYLDCTQPCAGNEPSVVFGSFQ